MAGEATRNTRVKLSLVLVTRFGIDRLQRALEAFSALWIAPELEVVIVGPEAGGVAQAGKFARVVQVPWNDFASMGRPRAAGVRATTAPYVAFGEDHCFPLQGWGRALLRRLEEGWTGVGPVILNHNPASLTSRTDWLINYGVYGVRGQNGRVNGIPPHNSAYRTDVLQAMGPELAELLEMEHFLQERLLAGGGQLYREPEAQASHVNVSTLSAHWKAAYHGGRVYGWQRVQINQWAWPRRVFYAAALPAIAALRLVRSARCAPDRGDWPVLAMLAVAAAVGSLGEVCGYLFGPGHSIAQRVNTELDRLSGLRTVERPLLLP